MKKILIIVSMVVALGLVGAGVYFYQNSQGTLAIEQLIPQGTWAYVRYSDVEKSWTDFTATKLWQNVIAIDVPAIMEKSGLSEKQIAATGYHKIKKSFSNPELNSLFMKFFGKEFAIALFPIEIKDLKTNSMGDFLSSVTLITRLKPDAQVTQILADILKQFDSNLKTSTVDYKRHKITLFEVPRQKTTIGYVRIKDLLILGVGDQAAKRCIDVFSKDKQPLSNDPTFQKAQAKYLPSPRTVGYCNMEFIYHDIMRLALSTQNKQSPQEQDRLNQELDKIIKKVSGFEAIGFSSSIVPMDTQKLDIIYNKPKLDPQFRQSYSCAPQENTTLRFVPQNVIGYKWSNYLDIKSQWESIKEELNNIKAGDSRASSMDAIITTLEKSLKMSIENDILPAIGSEIGGYVSDISTEGMFPFPKFLFFVKAKDRTAMDRVLAALSSNPQVVLQNDNYKNIPLKYLALSLGQDLQPAYCFLNDFLLFASSRQLLKDSIDAADSSAESLDVSPAFKSVNLGLTDKTNSILFVNLEDLWIRILVIVEWQVSQMKAKVSQQQAFKEGMEKRLEDSQKDLKKEESELALLKSTLKSTNDQLKSLQAQGMDVAATLMKIDQLEKKIEAKNDSIRNIKSDQEEATETIQTFKEEKVNPELVDLYAHQVIFPILDGLSTYKALGTKLIFGEDAMESTMYIKK